MNIPIAKNAWLYYGAALCVFINILMLLPLAVGRYSLWSTEQKLAHNSLTAARSSLGLAEKWLGYSSDGVDEYRLQIVAGDFEFKAAKKSKNTRELLAGMERAEEYYLKAATLEPVAVDAWFGLVRTTPLLEKLYPFVKKEPHKRAALTYFDRLVELMPVNLYVQKLLTKYYLDRSMPDKVMDSVEFSVYLSPSLYYQLRQQPFYSLSMNSGIKKALKRRIEENIGVDECYKVLAAIEENEENYRAAAAFHEKTLEWLPPDQRSTWYYQAGRLYLKAGMAAKAEEAFLKSLKTEKRPDRLRDIYRIYEYSKRFNEFVTFCNKAGQGGRDDIVKILSSMALIEMGKYDRARSRLLRVNSRKYLAESCYFQARIAEFLQDWDTMELKSQRATVLAPGNSEYYSIFSSALRRQKKYAQAEEAATRAIEVLVKPLANKYQERAWIRWERRDYQGAKEDWQSAVRYAPKTGWYHFRLAMVYEKMGELQNALIHIERGLLLQPDNAEHIKKRKELLEKIKRNT